MVFGNPMVNPYGTPRELAFQRLVSTLIKEEEHREAYWLEKTILFYERCICERESQGKDFQNLIEYLHEDLLRLIRLTKDLKWLVHFRE
jgi:hypothetical protein